MSSQSPPESALAPLQGPSTRKRSGAQAGVPPRIAGSYQRQKTANACLVCRARKTKCDNNRPVCGFCKRTGGECQYSEPASLRFDQASLTILKQLDRLENLLETRSELTNATGKSYEEPDQSPDSHTPGNTVRVVADGHGLGPALYTSEIHSSGLDSHYDIIGVSGSGSRPVNSIDVPPSSDVISIASAEVGIDAMLRWPVFENRLSAIGISASETSIELLGTVSSGLECSADNDERVRTTVENLRLDQETVHHLIENFLVNNNPKNPILDPTWLRRDAQEFVQSPLQWDGKACLILLVLAISSISTPLSTNHSRQQISISRNEPAFKAAELYFQASQRHIGVLYCENSLVSAQCAFLTGVYLMYTMRIMAAWKAFVQAGTQCLGYLASKRLIDVVADVNSSTKGRGGLDTYTDNRSSHSSRLQALEDGLYWSCLKSEVELRLELGLPGSGINSKNYPHVFPSVPSLEEVELLPDFTESPRSNPLSLETDHAYLIIGWFFYLGEIALRKLLYRVLNSRYGDHRSRGLELHKEPEMWRSTTEFDLQLQQWTQSVPQPMKFSTSSSEPLYDILPWVLRGHRIDVIELLRFPAISSILNTDAVSLPVSSWSPTITLLAREFLENAVHRIETNSEGFFHRHQGSWLTIRSCCRSALALLGVKLYSQDDNEIGGRTNVANKILADRILPPAWKLAVLQVLEMLNAWEWESRDVGRLREIIEGLLGLCLD